MYGKKVQVTLGDGREIVGYFNDEFCDDESILVSSTDLHIIKISDIEQMEALKDD